MYYLVNVAIPLNLFTLTSMIMQYIRGFLLLIFVTLITIDYLYNIIIIKLSKTAS